MVVALQTWHIMTARYPHLAPSASILGSCAPQIVQGTAFPVMGLEKLPRRCIMLVYVTGSMLVSFVEKRGHFKT